MPLLDSHPTAAELDDAPMLPDDHRKSLVFVLAVQALNAFNDNFVKILLIVFAKAVASGTELGDHLQTYMGAVFSLPYVLFGPLAGWLSDRFSKKWVILWMQVFQVAVFGFFMMALMVHEAQWTLVLSLLGFFLLATQAAFFSPAKMGVIKELVGSRRVGAVSGWLQMTMFIGIFSGMWAGGTWFGVRLAEYHKNPWPAVWTPIVVVSIVAVAQIVGALLIHRTPTHRDVKFHRSVLTEHFGHLRLLFAQRSLKLAGLGITLFWFLSNSVATILVGLSRDLYPGDDVSATKALPVVIASLGIGIAAGSLLVFFVCRRRIELGLVPLAGAGLTLGLLGDGLLMNHGGWLYASLAFTGISGGCFMTPLYAFVQDRAKPDERARVLSAVNLMDCLSAIGAVGMVEIMLLIKIPSHIQMLLLVPIALGATIFITKLLPQNLLRFVLGALLRTVYRLKGHHQELVPKRGGVLLVANHISYADAVLLGAICERDVRFVMIDSLYKLPAIHWFSKTFGTVPISPTKAKEAIRTVADCLKKGECVCLFAEGQLTRTGFVNRIHKGFEVMARLGGAPVQPVWLEGLWGSIFSYEGGRFFQKVPKAIPYQVSAWFGNPMSGSEIDVEALRSAWGSLAAEAFAARDVVRRTPLLKRRDGKLLEPAAAQTAHVNALRILETSLLREHDVIVCLLTLDHPVAATVFAALPALRRLTVVGSLDELRSVTREGGRIIAIGELGQVIAVRSSSASAQTPWDVAVALVPSEQGAALAAPDAAETYPAIFDAASGALLTLSVPDPQMPKGEESAQVGHKFGSVGKVLPGIAVSIESAAIVLKSVTPGANADIIRFEGAVLDEDGFVFPPSGSVG